jgi:hypothetical protein
MNGRWAPPIARWYSASGDAWSQTTIAAASAVREASDVIVPPAASRMHGAGWLSPYANAAYSASRFCFLSASLDDLLCRDPEQVQE